MTLARGERTACDCLVIGGGPAGAAVAARLAHWGRAVVLVDDGRKKHAFPEETLVPAAARTIESLGFDRVFAAHRFFGVARQGVAWGSAEPAWRDLEPAQRGFQVERGVFDRALREHVRECGVRVLDDHRVRSRLPSDGRGTVRVEGHASAALEVEASTIVIAAGRGQHRTLASTEIVARAAPTSTLSFVGSTPAALGAGTLIEAVPSGWLWWIPQRGARCCVAVFVDTAELEQRGHRELIEESFAASSVGALDTGSMKPAFGANCTARLVRAFAPIVLCGDAASTVDPLSSQGVEKALASAEHAAHTIETILTTPALAAAANAHHAAWERRLWRGHAREATKWYSNEPRFTDRAFWRSRRGSADSTEPLRPDAQLLAHADLEPCPALRETARGFDAVPGFARRCAAVGIASVGRIPVAPLLRIVNRPISLRDALGLASREPELFPLPPRAVVSALEFLVDEGFVLATAGPHGPELPQPPGTP